MDIFLTTITSLPLKQSKKIPIEILISQNTTLVSLEVNTEIPLSLLFKGLEKNTTLKELHIIGLNDYYDGSRLNINKLVVRISDSANETRLSHIVSIMSKNTSITSLNICNILPTTPSFWEHISRNIYNLKELSIHIQMGHFVLALPYLIKNTSITSLHLYELTLQYARYMKHYEKYIHFLLTRTNLVSLTVPHALIQYNGWSKMTQLKSLNVYGKPAGTLMENYYIEQNVSIINYSHKDRNFNTCERKWIHRNRTYRWNYVKNRIIETYLIFHNKIIATPYVFLWIMDRILQNPIVDTKEIMFVTHLQKIRLIESLMVSCKNIKLRKVVK